MSNEKHSGMASLERGVQEACRRGSSETLFTGIRLSEIFLIVMLFSACISFFLKYTYTKEVKLKVTGQGCLIYMITLILTGYVAER